MQETVKKIKRIDINSQNKNPASSTVFVEFQPV
jgi:hypothetical protein